MIASLAGRLITLSIAVIFIAVLIMTVKKLMKRHLSPQVQYLLWFPFLFILAIPFIPFRFSGYFSLFSWVNQIKSAKGIITTEWSSAARLNEISGDWLKDFSVSVSGQVPDGFYWIVLLFWLPGVIFMTIVTVHSCMRIRLLRQASLPLQDKKARQLFDSCKQELHVKQTIPVLSTAYLKSPVTVGVMRPCIIIPISVLKELPENELRFILMHELLHCKRKDTLINLFICLARILYWFHPIVWIAMSQLRNDEESACDGAVLARLEKKDFLSYGNTLLKLAAGISGLSYTPSASMAGKKKELKKRILGIRDYRYETRLDKVKGTAVLIMVTALVWNVIPPISSSADTRGSCQLLSVPVEEVDLSSYFHGYEGSFVWYDTNTDQFSIYNRKAACKRISPDSTYKIYSALTALQNEVITPDSTTQKWNQTEYPFEVWNQDQTLSSAMKHSVNWYFQSLDRQSGLSGLKETMSALSYGNQDLSGGLETFWLEGSLKISPVEQVELLTRLSEETLPFDAGNMQAVKEALYLSNSNGVSLYGKTGTGTVNQKDRNGWFIGFVKSSQNTHVFAVNIQGKDGASGFVAGEIALEILRDKKIYQE